MSWDGGVIEVGRGTTMHSGRIMLYEDDNMFWVNAAEFGQGVQYQGGHDLTWEIPMLSLREYYI